MQVKLVGNLLSPYVRKVVFVLKQKQVPFSLNPVTAMYGNKVLIFISVF